MGDLRRRRRAARWSTRSPSRTGSTACSSAAPRRTACASSARCARRSWPPSSPTRCATGSRRRDPRRHAHGHRGRLPGRSPRLRARPGGGAPRTPVGMLVRGLEARRAAGVDTPLAIVSCDNLPRNGAVLRELVEDFCARAGPTGRRTGSPITPTSPRTMVDRIVPAATRRRPRHGEPPDRRPRRGDRRRRAVQPVGDRGRLPRAPARVGGRGGAARARHRALRDDEAAASSTAATPRSPTSACCAGTRPSRTRSPTPSCARSSSSCSRPSSPRRSRRSPASTSTATARTS